MNLSKVCSEMPSIFIPALDTKRSNFLICFAGHASLVQCKVSVPLTALSLTTASWWHTGQLFGISNVPTDWMTRITFGIILLALMTDSVLPGPPIPNRLHSLILQSEARCTVVPSNSTGANTATGEMVEAAHDHSIWRSVVVAASSCHLKANPARVA